MKKQTKNLWILLLIIVIAIFVGLHLTPTDKNTFSIYLIFDLISHLFINALTLIVIPLIFSSLIVGVAKIAKIGSFGRIGGKMIGLFILTNFLAVFIGFLITLFFSDYFFASAQTILTSHLSSSFLPSPPLQPLTPPSFYHTILQIIPPNIITVFSQNQILGLIFFSIVFGYSLTHLKSDTFTMIHNFFNGIFQAMIAFTHFILKFLPLAVFCLIAKHIADTGLHTLISLGFFLTVVLIALFLFVLIIPPLLLKLFTGYSFITHIKHILPAIITAFSTSSSSAALPIAIDCVEKNIGVSNRIASLVLPLGASLNTAASALYAYLASFFLLQFYGIENTWQMQVFLLIFSLLSSLAVASIPSGAIMIVIIILKGFGLSVEWVALLFAIDRIIDMFRSSFNTITITISGVIIAHHEKEKKLYKKNI